MTVGRPERVRIGRVVRPHRLSGEVVVREGGLGAREFEGLGEIALTREASETVRRARIRSVRSHGADLLVSLAGIESPEAAAELRGLWVEVERGALPDAGPDQVYHFELLGLEVVDESGRALGRVTRVWVTGANEVLAVEGPAGEIMIPYHSETIVGWDRSARRLEVRLPAGLEDVYRKPEPGRG